MYIMIKAVLIDIDNTLLDFMKSAKKSIRLCFEKEGLTFSEHVFSTFYEINEGLWKKIEKKELTKEEMYKLRWTTIFNALGIERDGIEFEKLFRSTLSGIAETVPTVDGIIEKHEYVNSFPILIWDEKDRKSEVHISYKDGFLYMGVQMKSGAPINTQIDFGNASCNSPYVTVNRTTQQISLNGKLSTSGGQLMRCNDGKAWNLRGDHPSGDGALMLTQAATSWKDGVMTFEYVADVVKLIKWFADHEAYCESEVELASRAITWQCWAPESDTGVKGVQSQFTCPSSNAYFGVYFPGQTITWNWVMHTIVLPEQPAVHLSDSYIEPPIPEIPTLPSPEDGSDATEEITTAEPESTATVTETITAEAATKPEATTDDAGGGTSQTTGCRSSVASSAVILAIIGCGFLAAWQKKKH